MSQDAILIKKSLTTPPRLQSPASCLQYCSSQAWFWSGFLYPPIPRTLGTGLLKIGRL